MSIIRLTKIFHFEMAHALYGYDGACKNIHGHSYQLLVTIKGIPISDDTNPKNGMVLDFSVLKHIVKSSIIDELDHALALNANSPHKELKGKNNLLFERIILLPYQPTCENLLADFAERIKKQLPENIQLHSLKLKETPSSYAEWFEEDNNN